MLGKGLYRAKVARIGAGMAGQERKELSMTGFTVFARLALAVESAPEAADGANEILRDLQREYAPDSCLIDYALDGFQPCEIGADYQEGEAFAGLNLAAELPAMVEALRWALSMAEEAILVRENGDDPEDTPDICEMHRAELERHRAILSRIDGAGDTLPDAPAPAPTSEESEPLKAARGYASNPEQWNPPSPEQMAALLAMLGER